MKTLDKLLESIVEQELTMVDEAAKTMKDLNGGGLALFKKHIGNTIEFYLYDPSKVQEMMTSFTKYNAIDVMVGYLDMKEKPNCDAWIISSAAALRGFGPIMYTIALSEVSPDYLASDRNLTSDDARRVWDYFYTHRANEFNIKPNGNDCEHTDATQGEDPALFHAFSLKRPVKFSQLEQRHLEMWNKLGDDLQKKLTLAGDWFFYDLYQ